MNEIRVMKFKRFEGSVGKLLLALVVAITASIPPFAVAGTEAAAILLQAARVFDGENVRTNAAVLVENGKVARIDSRASLKHENAKVIDLGDATLLPGFIELHAHLTFQHVPEDTVLKHGITTVRDVGGPVHQPYGGQGNLRVLTSGPMITAPGGYPIPNMGAKDIAIAVANAEEARKTVRALVEGGAVVIKVALEPGGEAGAPWSSSHSHNHKGADAEQRHPHHPHQHEKAGLKQGWPLLPEEIVRAIVDEAHKNNRRVTAHVAEEKGVAIAINSGIQEWAHMPCNVIPETLLKKAVAQQVKIVSTLDTLSRCSGVAQNSAAWKLLGGKFLYGAEIAHPDIPWGIDAQELAYLAHMAGMRPVEVLRTATANAGRHLGVPLLGTLQPGAPADMIAVRGDPMHNFKILEYPDLVISGGEIIVNNFEN